MKKRIIALLIACIMVFGAMPVVTISAADDTWVPAEDQCECDEANKTASAGNTFTGKRVAATCWSYAYDVYTHDKSTENGATPCGKTYIVLIAEPTYAHNYVDVPAQAPDCATGTPGWTAYQYCDNSVHCPMREELVKPNHMVEATHSYVDTVVGPTCTDEGYTEHKCSACGDTYKDTPVDALGHTWDDATCTAPKTCSACGATDGDALGHTWVEDEDARQEPGCYAPEHGTKFFDCSVCGATKTETILAPDEHDYEVTKHPATCQSPAYEEHVCKRCGYALNPIYEGSALPHTEVIDAAVAPTCTTDGLTEGKHCSVCNEVIVAQTVIPATGHQYVSTIVPPNCTEDGYTEHVCSVCGDSYKDSTVTRDPLSHVAVITVHDIPATCQKGGMTYESRCQYCNLLLHAPEPTPIDPDAHTNLVDVPAVAPTCTVDGSTAGEKCADCGVFTVPTTVLVATGHNLTSTAAQAPTCTEIGWNDYETCSKCDYTTYVEIPATGHTKGTTEGVVKPTCTEQGYTVYECTVCNASFKDDFVPAIGHTYVDTVVAPTCTDAGYTEHTCHCGDTYTDTPVDALGHTEAEIPAVAPTCTTDGATVGTKCSVCDTVITAPTAIPATGHTEVEIPAQAPTCTTEGATAGTKCSVCDAVVTAPAVVPATGHTPVEIPAIPADYNNTGMSAGEKCSVCEEILKAPTATSVLDESVKFTYTATGINGSTNAVNSGYIILDVYLNVETDIARLWAIDLTLNYDANLTLVKVEGLILNDMHYTALDTANAAHQVTLTQSMGATDPNSKTFEKGVYKFMTLTFKVDKNAKNYTANFDVDSGLVVRGDDVKDLNNLVVDLGTGASIRVTMLGDANGDGALNSKDSLEMTNWSIANSDKLDAYAECYDMNKDGIIDGVDYALLRMAVVHNNDYLDTDDYNLNP